MDEEDEFVLLEFNNQIPNDSRKHLRTLPNANSLFKQIENETEAIKELSNKKNNNNIYEKVKKSLEDKLSYGRSTRGMCVDEQMNIRDMISTCNQRKHIRSFDVWKKNAEANAQVYKARHRNYSAKEIKKDCLYSKKTIMRPKTSNIQTPGNRSNELLRHTTGDTLNFSFLTTIHEDKPSRITKHTKARNLSKNLQNKQNEPSTIKSYYLGSNHLKKEAIQGRKSGLKKGQRNHIQLKNRFESIINHCKFEKKSIKFLDKKIDNFSYFCDKITKEKSVIQNFCNRMETAKFLYDDEFD